MQTAWEFPKKGNQSEDFLYEELGNYRRYGNRKWKWKIRFPRHHTERVLTHLLYSEIPNGFTLGWGANKEIKLWDGREWGQLTSLWSLTLPRSRSHCSILLFINIREYHEYSMMSGISIWRMFVFIFNPKSRWWMGEGGMNYRRCKWQLILSLDKYKKPVHWITVYICNTSRLKYL